MKWWLIFGILSSLIAGLWGLFDKLSSFQNSFVSTIILYSTATLLSFLLFVIFTKKLKFSKYGFLAGASAGIGTLFLLYSLMKNSLILIFPFVSMGAVVFFLMILIIDKPKYAGKQKVLISLGMILSFIGIFVVATGSVGFANFFKEFRLSWIYVIEGIVVLLGGASWTYLTYKSASKERVNTVTYNFWNFFGSFVVGIIAFFIFFPGSALSSITFKGIIYPVLAGLCIMWACFFAFKSFKGTTTKTKVQEAMVGILTNCELIPLFFFSYFILHEWVIEGFIGSLMVIVGLVVLNLAESVK